MPKELKTDWKRIGRSGATVDARVIEPAWLTQAANNYSKDLFTALIWPEHERWYNMGTIEALRTESNSEGGVDLYALIAPNDYYLAANKSGQKLFTSMELRPNFRDTGEYYLTGCAATDNPASAATSEVRFSASGHDDLVLGQHIEFTTHQFTQDEEQALGLLTRLFNRLTKSDEGDMKQETAEQLLSSINTLTDAVKAFSTSGDNPGTPAAEGNGDTELTPEKFAALQAEVNELKAKIESFSAGDGEADDKGDATITAQQYNDLKASLDKLTEDFKAAVGEQEGTDPGVNTGDDKDLEDWI